MDNDPVECIQIHTCRYFIGLRALETFNVPEIDTGGRDLIAFREKHINPRSVADLEITAEIEDKPVIIRRVYGKGRGAAYRIVYAGAFGELAAAAGLHLGDGQGDRYAGDPVRCCCQSGCTVMQSMNQTG